MASAVLELDSQWSSKDMTKDDAELSQSVTHSRLPHSGSHEKRIGVVTDTSNFKRESSGRPPLVTTRDQWNAVQQPATSSSDLSVSSLGSIPSTRQVTGPGVVSGEAGRMAPAFRRQGPRNSSLISSRKGLSAVSLVSLSVRTWIDPVPYLIGSVSLSAPRAAESPVRRANTLPPAEPSAARTRSGSDHKRSASSNVPVMAGRPSSTSNSKSTSSESSRSGSVSSVSHSPPRQTLTESSQEDDIKGLAMVEEQDEDSDDEDSVVGGSSLTLAAMRAKIMESDELKWFIPPYFLFESSKAPGSSDARDGSRDPRRTTGHNVRDASGNSSAASVASAASTVPSIAIGTVEDTAGAAKGAPIYPVPFTMEHDVMVTDALVRGPAGGLGLVLRQCSSVDLQPAPLPEPTGSALKSTESDADTKDPAKHVKISVHPRPRAAAEEDEQEAPQVEDLTDAMVGHTRVRKDTFGMHERSRSAPGSDKGDATQEAPAKKTIKRPKTTRVPRYANATTSYRSRLASVPASVKQRQQMKSAALSRAARGRARARASSSVNADVNEDIPVGDVVETRERSSSSHMRSSSAPDNFTESAQEMLEALKQRREEFTRTRSLESAQTAPRRRSSPKKVVVKKKQLRPSAKQQTVPVVKPGKTVKTGKKGVRKSKKMAKKAVAVPDTIESPRDHVSSAQGNHHAQEQEDDDAQVEMKNPLELLQQAHKALWSLADVQRVYMETMTPGHSVDNTPRERISASADYAVKFAKPSVKGVNDAQTDIESSATPRPIQIMASTHAYAIDRDYHSSDMTEIMSLAGQSIASASVSPPSFLGDVQLNSAARITEAHATMLLSQLERLSTLVSEDTKQSLVPDTARGPAKLLVETAQFFLYAVLSRLSELKSPNSPVANGQRKEAWHLDQVMLLAVSAKLVTTVTASLHLSLDRFQPALNTFSSASSLTQLQARSQSKLDRSESDSAVVWMCGACANKNHISSDVCASCGSSRPEDFLERSTRMASRSKVVSAWFDLHSAILSQIALRMSPLVALRGAKLTFRMSKKVPSTLCGNPDVVLAVLLPLVQNALESCPLGSEVVVAVHAEEQSLVSVRRPQRAWTHSGHSNLSSASRPSLFSDSDSVARSGGGRRGRAGGADDSTADLDSKDAERPAITAQALSSLEEVTHHEYKTDSVRPDVRMRQPSGDEDSEHRVPAGASESSFNSAMAVSSGPAGPVDTVATFLHFKVHQVFASSDDSTSASNRDICTQDQLRTALELGLLDITEEPQATLMRSLLAINRARQEVEAELSLDIERKASVERPDSDSESTKKGSPSTPVREFSSRSLRTIEQPAEREQNAFERTGAAAPVMDAVACAHMTAKRLESMRLRGLGLRVVKKLLPLCDGALRFTLTPVESHAAASAEADADELDPQIDQWCADVMLIVPFYYLPSTTDVPVRDSGLAIVHEPTLQNSPNQNTSAKDGKDGKGDGGKGGRSGRSSGSSSSGKNSSPCSILSLDPPHGGSPRPFVQNSDYVALDVSGEPSSAQRPSQWAGWDSDVTDLTPDTVRRLLAVTCSTALLYILVMLPVFRLAYARYSLSWLANGSYLGVQFLSQMLLVVYAWRLAYASPAAETGLTWDAVKSASPWLWRFMKFACVCVPFLMIPAGYFRNRDYLMWVDGEDQEEGYAYVWLVAGPLLYGSCFVLYPYMYLKLDPLKVLDKPHAFMFQPVVANDKDDHKSANANGSNSVQLVQLSRSSSETEFDVERTSTSPRAGPVSRTWASLHAHGEQDWSPPMLCLPRSTWSSTSAKQGSSTVKQEPDPIFGTNSLHSDSVTGGLRLEHFQDMADVESGRFAVVGAAMLSSDQALEHQDDAGDAVDPGNPGGIWDSGDAQDAGDHGRSAGWKHNAHTMALAKGVSLKGLARASTQRQSQRSATGLDLDQGVPHAYRKRRRHSKAHLQLRQKIITKIVQHRQRSRSDDSDRRSVVLGAGGGADEDTDSRSVAAATPSLHSSTGSDVAPYRNDDTVRLAMVLNTAGEPYTDEKATRSRTRPVLAMSSRKEYMNATLARQGMLSGSADSSDTADAQSVQYARSLLEAGPSVFFTAKRPAWLSRLLWAWCTLTLLLISVGVFAWVVEPSLNTLVVGLAMFVGGGYWFFFIVHTLVGYFRPHYSGFIFSIAVALVLPVALLQITLVEIGDTHKEQERGDGDVAAGSTLVAAIAFGCFSWYARQMSLRAFRLCTHGTYLPFLLSLPFAMYSDVFVSMVFLEMDSLGVMALLLVLQTAREVIQSGGFARDFFVWASGKTLTLPQQISMWEVKRVLAHLDYFTAMTSLVTVASAIAYEVWQDGASIGANVLSPDWDKEHSYEVLVVLGCRLVTLHIGKFTVDCILTSKLQHLQRSAELQADISAAQDGSGGDGRRSSRVGAGGAASLLPQHLRTDQQHCRPVLNIPVRLLAVWLAVVVFMCVHEVLNQKAWTNRVLLKL